MQDLTPYHTGCLTPRLHLHSAFSFNYSVLVFLFVFCFFLPFCKTGWCVFTGSGSRFWGFVCVCLSQENLEGVEVNVVEFNM